MGAGTSVELLERIETHISIRSPHAGRDSPGNDGDGNHRSFQSTRPMRGETRSCLSVRVIHADFNPFAPCGARPRCRMAIYSLKRHFNPLAPCGARRSQYPPPPYRRYFNPLALCGARPSTLYTQTVFSKFQSTRPMRGETAIWRIERFS